MNPAIARTRINPAVILLVKFANSIEHLKTDHMPHIYSKAIIIRAIYILPDADPGLTQLDSKLLKVSNGAKIRNRYNQVPYPTQNTNGKVTNSQKTPQTRAKRSALSQQIISLDRAALWLSGSIINSRPRGRRFEPHRHHSVVSLSKTH